MDKKSNGQKYDGIVICSTQNQMVNYLTILQHIDDFKEEVDLINITFSEDYSKFKNKYWDENLEKVLSNNNLLSFIKRIQPIEFSRNQIINHDSIRKKLEIGINKKYSKDQKLLWNITGGQRHIVMAITKFVHNQRPNDIIVYFEGNQSKFYYYPSNDKKKEPKEIDKNILNYEKFNLNIALELMGFELDEKSKNHEEYNYLISDNYEEFKEKCNDKEEAENIWEKYENEKQCYNNLYEDFVKYENLDLLDILVRTNKNSNNPEKLTLNQVASELMELKLKYFNKKDLETFKKSLEKVSNEKLFGYIFEYMVFYKIIAFLKKEENSEYLKKIADIHLSAKAKFTEKEHDSKLGIIDEFDIAILTISGKVIILECKSGGFTGDNIKSHHYSTYAVSGVYGTPILIIPITEKMTQFDNKDLIEESIKKENKAKRANVEFCYLDKIEEKLIEILKREA